MLFAYVAGEAWHHGAPSLDRRGNSGTSSRPSKS